MGKISAYARLLRLPGLGGLAIPPVIGAVTVGVFDLQILSLLFLIGAFCVIYGFVLNDYVDIDLDKLVKELHGKPLVSGEISRKSALTISFFCVVLVFLSVFLLWKGEIIDDRKIEAILSLVLAGIFGTIYNIYGKMFVCSDVLVSLSVAFLFLFGALSVGEPNPITWIVFVLTFNNLMHMNMIEGGIKDADHDYLMNVKNVALALGVKVQGKNVTIPTSLKSISLGIRTFSSVLLLSPFVILGYSYYPWQIGLLLILILLVFYLTIKLLSIKVFDRDKIRKYIAAMSFLRYSLVPIMLIPFIGFEYSLMLIVFPFAWYVVFAPLIGEKLFRPRM